MFHASFLWVAVLRQGNGSHDLPLSCAVNCNKYGWSIAYGRWFDYLNSFNDSVLYIATLECFVSFVSVQTLYVDIFLDVEFKNYMMFLIFLF